MYPTAYTWIRKPTPVISRTNRPDSGSNSNPTSTFSPPTGMYRNRSIDALRLPDSPDSETK